MRTLKKQAGQTLIETAFVLFLLLLILLGITEFSRAWYTKNSLKNAARQGARVAVVTPSIVNGTATKPATLPTNCDGLTGNAKVFCEIWIASPGVHSGATATISVDLGSDSTLNSGDVVTVTVSSVFNFIVGNSPWPWGRTQTFTTNASMRYEL